MRTVHVMNFCMLTSVIANGCYYSVRDQEIFFFFKILIRKYITPIDHKHTEEAHRGRQVSLLMIAHELRHPGAFSNTC